MRGLLRTVGANHFAQALQNGFQAVCQRLGRAGPDAAAGDIDQAAADLLDDAKAGDAQSRIDAQYANRPRGH